MAPIRVASVGGSFGAGGANGCGGGTAGTAQKPAVLYINGSCRLKLYLSGETGAAETPASRAAPRFMVPMRLKSGDNA